MGLPAGMAPAGMTTTALPPVSVAGADAYPPLVSFTVPVARGAPEPGPVTETATFRVCPVLMLRESGVTVTAGTAADTVTVALPATVPYTSLAAASGVKEAFRARLPATSEYAGMVMPAVPFARMAAPDW